MHPWKALLDKEEKDKNDVDEPVAIEIPPIDAKSDKTEDQNTKRNEIKENSELTKEVEVSDKGATREFSEQANIFHESTENASKEKEEIEEITKL